MTNKEILEIALEQSAVDCSCSAEDFLQAENRVVLSKPHRNARNIFLCRWNVIWYPTAITL